MSSDRCKLLHEGFLDVKYPPNSPERALHKVWKKQWVCASIMHPPGRGEPHFILHLMKGPQDKHLRSIKATRDNLRLFRCSSSSRPLRTFAISSGGSLLVYLAAQNEQETQHWIELIRCGLWPPINTFKDSPHDVSLIDDEKTFSSGLLGVYGRLVKTADNMFNIIHPHWQGTLLRWKQEDIANIVLVRKVGGDHSSAGVFKITLRSSNKVDRNLHFYSSMVEEAISWLQSKRRASEESTLKEDLDIQSNFKSSQPSEISYNGEFSYGTINKSLEKTIEDNLEKPSLTNTSEKHSETNTTDNHLFVNISSDLLDASINSIKMLNDETTEKEINFDIQIKEEADLDSSIESLDHVYEDLSRRTESIGAYTLYEEIDDSESDYVLPSPPQLPERPIQNANSLRLLKLSESVAEALKIAEDIPKPIEEQNPDVLKKRAQKKSKSLRRPKETPSRNLQDKSVLKRASSESDLTDSVISKTDASANSDCYLNTNNINLSNNSEIKDLVGGNSPEKINFTQIETGEHTANSELKKFLDAKNLPKSNLVVPKEEGDYIRMK